MERLKEHARHSFCPLTAHTDVSTQPEIVNIAEGDDPLFWVYLPYWPCSAIPPGSLAESRGVVYEGVGGWGPLDVTVIASVSRSRSNHYLRRTR